MWKSVTLQNPWSWRTTTPGGLRRPASSYRNRQARRAVLAALFCVAALLSGCGQDRSVPYEATLVDSGGNGGWVLFDSAPENYEKGHTFALEEEAKVTVTGSTVTGRFGASKLVPVTVRSGKFTGRTGWLISTALGQQ